MSVQDLQQNPQDTSNFYLANIYQATINPNISDSHPASPPPFSPPNSAVWVNALWFLSLVISLTCALLATLLQQWARRYLKITQSRYSLHKRARIRAFFSEGVDKRLLPWAVDSLPTLLHISLFLFFAGLVVFLCSVNLTIFKLVLSWVGLCTALYGFITCMPIIRHDSPYYTPLSLPTWHIVTGILLFAYRFLRWFASVLSHYDALHRFRNLEKSCHKSLAQGMQKTAEETALSSPSEIDTRAFMWTFDCLDEAHELERFFSGLPGFRSSEVVHDPLPGLTEEEKSKLSQGLGGLLNRTFSSDLLSVPVKHRRATICAKAVDPDHTPNACVLHAILFQYQHSGPVATAVAEILTEYVTNNMDGDRILCAEFAISKIIATRQLFDDSWYVLASNVLGFPETSLRGYATQGDSLSLVILIHIVRQQYIHFRKPSWPRIAFFSLLAAASNFDPKDTSPKLQHNFCALWNQIVREVHGNDREMANWILTPIRNIFLALHQDTNSAQTQFSASTNDWDHILRQPSSYPVCNVPDHRSDSTPHIHDDGISTIISCAIPDGHNHTASVPSLASSDSLFTASLSVDESLTGALLLDNQISAQGCTQHISQTTTESCRIPTTSMNPVTASLTHRIIDHFPRTMHRCASEPSTSGPPNSDASTSSLPDDVAVGRTGLNSAPSDNLNVQSSPTRATLDRNTNLPTGLLLFPDRDLI